jgi:hypothetical protein
MPRSVCSQATAACSQAATVDGSTTAVHGAMHPDGHRRRVSGSTTTDRGSPASSTCVVATPPPSAPLGSSTSPSQPPPTASSREREVGIWIMAVGGGQYGRLVRGTDMPDTSKMYLLSRIFLLLFLL